MLGEFIVSLPKLKSECAYLTVDQFMGMVNYKYLGFYYKVAKSFIFIKDWLNINSYYLLVNTWGAFHKAYVSKS